MVLFCGMPFGFVKVRKDANFYFFLPGALLGLICLWEYVTSIMHHNFQSLLIIAHPKAAVQSLVWSLHSQKFCLTEALLPNLWLKPHPKITFWKAIVFLNNFIFKYRESRRDKHSKAVQYLFTISSSKALEPGNNPFVQSNHLPNPQLVTVYKY